MMYGYTQKFAIRVAHSTRKMSLIKDRGQTLTLTLTCDLQFQSRVSHGSDPHTHKRSRPKFSQFERCSGNRQTDRRINGTDCITSRANTVSTNIYRKMSFQCWNHKLKWVAGHHVSFIPDFNCQQLSQHSAKIQLKTNDIPSMNTKRNVNSTNNTIYTYNTHTQYT